MGTGEGVCALSGLSVVHASVAARVMGVAWGREGAAVRGCELREMGAVSLGGREALQTETDPVGGCNDPTADASALAAMAMEKTEDGAVNDFELLRRGRRCLPLFLLLLLLPHLVTYEHCIANRRILSSESSPIFPHIPASAHLLFPLQFPFAGLPSHSVRILPQSWQVPVQPSRLPRPGHISPLQNPQCRFLRGGGAT